MPRRVIHVEFNFLRYMDTQAHARARSRSHTVERCVTHALRVRYASRLRLCTLRRGRSGITRGGSTAFDNLTAFYNLSFLLPAIAAAGVVSLFRFSVGRASTFDSRSLPLNRGPCARRAIRARKSERRSEIAKRNRLAPAAIVNIQFVIPLHSALVLPIHFYVRRRRPR